MPEFTITRQIGAPVETVWEVLNDFGDIYKWSPGVTELNLHYSYTPNMLGRLLKGYTDTQMRKGIAGLAKGLQTESERIHAA